MGVEGGSIGRGGGVASVGRAAVAVEAGGIGVRGISPSMGGLRGEILGLERTVPLGKVGWSLVNEGPVAPKFLENTMNLTAKRFNPIGQIVFNAPQVEPDLPVPQKVNQQLLQPADASRAVEEAQLIISQLKQAVVQSVAAPAEQTIIQPVVLPDPKVGQETAPELKPKTVYKTKTAPLLQTQIKEEILQKAAVEAEEPLKRIVEDAEQEQTEEDTLRLVEDEAKTERRKLELDDAIEEVAEEVENEGVEEVDGQRIISKLVAQNPADRSETINQEDPHNVILDGSLEQTKKEIRERKFASKKEAKEISFAINAKNRQEKWGHGNSITQEEHLTVHREHRHISKLTPLEITRRRVDKKRLIHSVPVISAETKQVKQETSLEDYPDLAAALTNL